MGTSGRSLSHFGSDRPAVHHWHEVVQHYRVYRLIGEDFQTRRAIRGDYHPVTRAFQNVLRIRRPISSSSMQRTNGIDTLEFPGIRLD